MYKYQTVSEEAFPLPCNHKGLLIKRQKFSDMLNNQMRTQLSQRSVLSPALPTEPNALTLRGLAGGRGGCGRGDGRGKVPPDEDWRLKNPDGCPPSSSETLSVVAIWLLLLSKAPLDCCDSRSGFGGRSGLTDSEAAIRWNSLQVIRLTFRKRNVFF